jgi:hypothetical protein
MKMDVNTSVMTTVNRTKRTYNLTERTLQRVRELANKRVARSQDAVLELAVDAYYREVRDQEEAAMWAASTGDPEFRAEIAGIADLYRDTETWPT